MKKYYSLIGMILFVIMASIGGIAHYKGYILETYQLVLLVITMFVGMFFMWIGQPKK